LLHEIEEVRRQALHRPGNVLLRHDGGQRYDRQSSTHEREQGGSPRADEMSVFTHAIRRVVGERKQRKTRLHTC
jgi:hypothetical protein